MTGPHRSLRHRLRPALGRMPAFAAAIVCLAGCVHVPAHNPHRSAEARPEAITAYFDPPDLVWSTRWVDSRRTGGLRITTAYRTSLAMEGSIRFEMYEPADDDGRPLPVVAVLPILQGTDVFTRTFARAFARNGFAAIIIEVPQRDTMLEDLRDPEPAIQRAVALHRAALDWLGENPRYDMTRLSVFGISLGGLNAVMLAGADPRVQTVVAALAGGDLAHIFTHSDESSVRRSVDKNLTALGMTRDEFQAYLDERIRYDTLDMVRFLDSRDIMLMTARFDRAVPYVDQVKLHEASGRPETVILPTGHLSSLLFIPYVRRQSVQFLRSRWDLER